MKVVCKFSLIVAVLALCAGSALADYQAEVLADSPIGYWRLEEASVLAALALVRGRRVARKSYTARRA